MIYFIVGLPGSGKTYWVQQLQNEISIIAIDLDKEIETKTGTTITDLFKISEFHFREKEGEILKSTIKEASYFSKNCIIATGGGTPCYKDNLKLMKENGTVIFLQANIKDILNRIKNSTSKRPLLPKDETELYEKLMALAEQRNPFYLQADIILDADNLTLPIFAKVLSSNFW